MPSNWRFSRFKSVFEAHGVFFKPTHHGHYKLSRWDSKTRKNRIYIVPTISGREVLGLYVGKARKALGLSAEDGVSDDDFSV